jgi:hypothetical protein
VATFLGSANLMVGESTPAGVRIGPVEFPPRRRRWRSGAGCRSSSALKTLPCGRTKPNSLDRRSVGASSSNAPSSAPSNACGCSLPAPCRGAHPGTGAPSAATTSRGSRPAAPRTWPAASRPGRRLHLSSACNGSTPWPIPGPLPGAGRFRGGRAFDPPLPATCRGAQAWVVVLSVDHGAGEVRPSAADPRADRRRPRRAGRARRGGRAAAGGCRGDRPPPVRPGAGRAGLGAR